MFLFVSNKKKIPRLQHRKVRENLKSQNKKSSFANETETLPMMRYTKIYSVHLKNGLYSFLHNFDTIL
jgi:hypothetical protein